MVDAFEVGKLLGKIEVRLDKLEEKQEESEWWESSWGCNLTLPEIMSLILDHLEITPKLVAKKKVQSDS
ncbi:hypothetical protein LCGC14_0406590 [marine sediment metagenome]|uniref:Uncharacterized protein n=1 Tax=marine sediment metagenome TaxID=412755 RepID=A0A0F9T0N8_9ZZZZ